tara:strand:- start:3721 stop:5547 length:1827 start_codon:yes stop_codon:yes gene_type:complete
MTAYATDTFSGDGSTVEFTIDFGYIQRDHVTVWRVENSDSSRTQLAVIAEGDPGANQYIWNSNTVVRVGQAPTAEQTLQVIRNTPEDQQLVQWQDGSYIVATDLNDSDQQWLYNIQELDDKFESLNAVAIRYQGSIDLTEDLAPDEPLGGTFYINVGVGDVIQGGDPGWVGIVGTAVVGGEQTIYNAVSQEWQIFEVPSTQTGVITVTGTAPITVNNTDAQRPVIGFTDAPSDTQQYVRQSAAVDGALSWQQVEIPPGTVIAAELPTDPEPDEGQLGYNTTDDRLYIWVENDQGVGSWVDASPAADPGVTQITAGNGIELDPEGGTGSVEISVPDLMPTGGGDDQIFYENGQTISTDYTIPNNTNAGTFGEVTIANNVTVTIPNSGTWTVVGGGDGVLWQRNGTTLSPVNAGDAVHVDSNFVALNTTDGNTTFGSLDFGGTDYKYAHISAGAAVISAIQSDGTGIFTNGAAIGGTDDDHTIEEYEQGSWTPNYQSGSAGGYNARAGSYVRVGNVVHFTANINGAGAGTASQLIIGGLPFTSSDTLLHAGAYAVLSGDIWGDNPAPLMTVPSENNRIEFYTPTGSDWAGSTGNGIQNRTLRVAGFYYID